MLINVLYLFGDWNHHRVFVHSIYVIKAIHHTTKSQYLSCSGMQIVQTLKNSNENYTLFLLHNVFGTSSR